MEGLFMRTINGVSVSGTVHCALVMAAAACVSPAGCVGLAFTSGQWRIVKGSDRGASFAPSVLPPDVLHNFAL